jgi:4-hydroxythreonine-4-phosphate dehydrogenase
VQKGPKQQLTPAEPRIAITMGDAAGIGPEIVLKSLRDDTLTQDCTIIIVGDLQHLRKAAAHYTPGARLEPLDESNDPDAVLVADLKNLPADFDLGTDAAVTGKASAEYIEKAVELWRQGRIDAIATAPISKKAIHLGGYDYPGHTEFLAALTGTERVAMSFFGGNLRVVLLSTHISLKEAIEQVTKGNLIDLITFADAQLAKLLNKTPKLAVAGLNPHASESGMFGTEEHNEISPAVAACRDRGMDVSGPYSPDTIFLRAHRGEFDAVIACYHDQATIPVKSISFGSSVNVTLGLPLIRTSVDHGTAYDIAGKGIADASSMKAAIRLAAELARSAPPA